MGMEVKQMEMTVYNPQKGRLETIDTVFTEENTTWFDNCAEGHEIYMITDFEGDLLIREFGHAYPVRIYNMCRADIGFDRRKAEELKNLYA
jgi:hypothetical protein